MGTGASTEIEHLEKLTYNSAFGLVASEQERIGHDRCGDKFRTTTYSYDCHGRLTTVTDPLGRQAITKYNDFDQVTETDDPSTNACCADAGKTVYTYCYSGGPLESTQRYVGGVLEQKTVNSYQDNGFAVGEETYGKGGITALANTTQTLNGLGDWTDQLNGTPSGGANPYPSAL